MGLDMYLYPSRDDGTPHDEWDTVDDGLDLTVSTEVAYWRKCHEVDHWFLRHIESYREDYGRVPAVLLDELYALCEAEQNVDEDNRTLERPNGWPGIALTIEQVDKLRERPDYAIETFWYWSG